MGKTGLIMKNLQLFNKILNNLEDIYDKSVIEIVYETSDIIKDDIKQLQKSDLEKDKIIALLLNQLKQYSENDLIIDINNTTFNNGLSISTLEKTFN